MKGIYIEGVDVKFLQVYEVAVEYGGRVGTVTIDNTILADLQSYGTEERMMDFLSTMSFLSGLVLYYERAVDELNRMELDIVNEQYVQFKTMRMEDMIGRDDLSKSRANEMPTDKLVISMLSVLTEVKNSRSNILNVSQTLNRLRSSYNIVDLAWNTARSINANERIERMG